MCVCVGVNGIGTGRMGCGEGIGVRNWRQEAGVGDMPGKGEGSTWRLELERGPEGGGTRGGKRGRWGCEGGERFGFNAAGV